MAKHDFKWHLFDTASKMATPHENRLCYIYSDLIPLEDAFIASYIDGEWYEYKSNEPIGEELANGLHWCYLPLPNRI